jgi:DNA-binding CsgD family transcriptional regulator
MGKRKLVVSERVSIERTAGRRGNGLLQRRRPSTFFILDNRNVPVFNTSDLSSGPLLSESLDAIEGVIERLGTLATTTFEPLRAGVVLRIVPLAGEGHPGHAVFIEALNGRQSLKEAVRRYDLTKREAEVLQLLLGGYSTAQIAGQLAIASGTVGDHVKALFRKTNTNGRSELVALVVHHEDDGLPGEVLAALATPAGDRIPRP